MTYLIVYLVVGFIVLSVLLILHHLSKKDDAQPFGEAFDTIDHEHNTFKYRMLDKVVVPMLTAVLVLAVWPVPIFMQIIELLTKKPVDATEDKGGFAVRRENLQAPLSISEIEAKESVSDPLDAAPPLPFGHLHSAWKAFLDEMKPEDTLWSFSAYWAMWERKQLREGYIIVRGDTVGAHFLTVWKDVEEPTEDVINQRAKNPA